MTKAKIEDARRIAEYAISNINHGDATKLCRALGPKLNDFQRSILADMVCRLADDTK